MKIVLISDVHGNIDALNALYKNEGRAMYFFAGDAVDWGFNPHEVLEWFRLHNVTAVWGNHDNEILEAIDSGRYDGVQNVENFTHYTINCLTEDDVKYLRSLPERRSFEIDGVEYYMMHYYEPDETCSISRPLSTFTVYETFLNVWGERFKEFSQKPKRIIIGHTHHCGVLSAGNDCLFINPGSLSYRLGADSVVKCGEYIVIENGDISLRRVEYPTQALLERLENSGFTERVKEIARCFYHTK